MGFIGKEPQTGAYNMLDNLSASATASYSLTLDSTAFVPESANHLLVSLNGVIQKAGSSYTVSGSTLTFSSSLASSDSIDFVLALGNVLDIGTPSDATVTNAKTNFVSTSSAAGLQIKGDGTTDGTLQLNCSQNSHGIKLKSPAHSTSSSYTLTFPGTDPSANKILQTDGSGNLSFVDTPSGGVNTPLFHASLGANQTIPDQTYTKINMTREVLDSNSKYDTTNKRFSPGETGYYYFNVCITLESGISASVTSYVVIYKNGSSIAINPVHSDITSASGSMNTVFIDQATSASDYYEAYMWHNKGSAVDLYESGSSSLTYWLGYKLIS